MWKDYGGAIKEEDQWNLEKKKNQQSLDGILKEVLTGLSEGLDRGGGAQR